MVSIVLRVLFIASSHSGPAKQEVSAVSLEWKWARKNISGIRLQALLKMTLKVNAQLHAMKSTETK
eukprot:scaffold316511_cov52-Prasinocladus_malaysianus.AAC.1